MQGHRALSDQVDAITNTLHFQFHDFVELSWIDIASVLGRIVVEFSLMREEHHAKMAGGTP